MGNGQGFATATRRMRDDIGVEERILLRLWQLERPAELLRLITSTITEDKQSSKIQEAILRCIKHPRTQKYPPANAYLRMLLKEVMLFAEIEHEEVTEELAALYTDVLLQPCQDAAWTYKTFCYRAHQDAPQDITNPGRKGPKITGVRDGIITLRVSQNLFEGNTGCHQWEAGFFLAEYVLNHPELVKGKCVLELGCGAGLLGIILHRMGAAAVCLTDGDAQALHNCRYNLHINGAEGAGMSTRVMSWSERPAEPCNVLLGADILYNPDPFPDLVNLIAEFVASGAEAYICTMVRQRATLDSFLRLVHQSGLYAQVAHTSCAGRDWPVQFLECLPLCCQDQQLLLHRITAKQTTHDQR